MLPAMEDASCDIGRWQTRLGPLYFRDRYFALDHRHGRYALAAALSGSRAVPGLTKFDIRNAAFLDIESGPRSEESGSFAFVAGVGRFEPFYFHLRQLFHREDTTEAAVMLALGELLDDAGCVITFNGTSFDLPRLAARFEAAGVKDALAGVSHLDLLHAARRICGAGLRSLRLAEIEEQLLGLQRSQRPAQPGRRAHPLLEHNEDDVLSLVILVAHLKRQAPRHAERDPRYLLSLGRMMEQDGEPGSAADAYRAAWSLDPSGHVGGEAILRLARILSRRRQWHEAAALWREELAVTPLIERQVHARVELAKLLERRLRDPEAALAVARETIDLLQSTSSVPRFTRSYVDLTRRALRLEARLGTGLGKSS